LAQTIFGITFALEGFLGAVEAKVSEYIRNFKSVKSNPDIQIYGFQQAQK
jgi:hypothetical protein